jgi:NAD(P)-dependent dehydrogenase (short-subunit alcohol dehydrogenase family)
MGVLEGARALVTGGGSGIGRATCRRMAVEGARVAVLDVDGDAAKAVAEEVGGRAYVADVGDADAVTAAVREAARDLGGLTVLFNNAGVGGLSRLHQWDRAQLRQVLRVNLEGVLWGLQAAIPLMLASGGGSIVNTASISGVRPAAGEGPYAATKAAVAALTASTALELAPDIRVNAVSPGMIRSQLTAPLLALPDEEDRHRTRTPMGRVGEPEDVADLVVFLCSDQARFITGQNIVVDGGMTLHGSGVDGLLDIVLGLMGDDAPDRRAPLS